MIDLRFKATGKNHWSHSYLFFDDWDSFGMSFNEGGGFFNIHFSRYEKYGKKYFLYIYVLGWRWSRYEYTASARSVHEDEDVR